ERQERDEMSAVPLACHSASLLLAVTAYAAFPAERTRRGPDRARNGPVWTPGSVARRGVSRFRFVSAPGAGVLTPERDGRTRSCKLPQVAGSRPAAREVREGSRSVRRLPRRIARARSALTSPPAAR